MPDITISLTDEQVELLKNKPQNIKSLLLSKGANLLSKIKTKGIVNEIDDNSALITQIIQQELNRIAKKSEFEKKVQEIKDKKIIKE